MSHSTVSTSVYVISKYSKAYTRNNRVQSQVQAPEWQHFANPVIKVVLDKTKSQSGEVESLRFRIIWNMSEGDGVGSSGQPPEDFDFLSFSNIEKNAPQTKHPEGLPIKSVYRDAVVCIRYLHLATQTYRRFQISFGSLADASSFINAIKLVCPCKLLPAPIGMLNSAGTMTNPPASTDVPRASSSSVPRQDSMTSARGHAVNNHVLMRQPNTTTGVHWAAREPPNEPAINFRDDAMLPLTSEPDIMYTTNTPIHPSYPHQQANQWNMGPPNFIPSSRRMAVATTERPPSSFNFTTVPVSSQLPPSSPPVLTPTPSSEQEYNGCITHTANASTAAAGGNRGPSQIPSNEDDAMLASLREATSIYNMTATQLEHAIGEIVREDGFIKLMERVSTMWRVHALVGVTE